MMRCDSASRVLAALGLLLLPGPASAQAPDLSSQVEIVRTAYGVPHIFADNFRAAGYALGWAQLEDYGDFVPSTLFHYRGELGLQFGRDSLADDFVNRPRWLLAVAHYPSLSDDARAFYEGYAAGVNRYLELHAAGFAAWLEPDFRGVDVLAADVEWPADVYRLRARRSENGEGGGQSLASEPPVIPSQAAVE